MPDDYDDDVATVTVRREFGWSDSKNWQYNTPVWGSAMRAQDALNDGNYFDYVGHMGIGVAEGLTFGMLTMGGVGVRGLQAGAGSVIRNEGANAVEQAAVHGNSLKSLKPTWGYKLYSNDGTFLKNGITNRVIPQTRYTKSFMSDKYMVPFKQFPNRLEAWQWEYQQNLIQKGPLNLNMH